MPDNLTDEQKSMMLAKAMEWYVESNGAGDIVYLDSNGLVIVGDFTYFDLATAPNLYDPANMALAWRVLNWAMTLPEIERPMKNWLGDNWRKTDQDNNTIFAPGWWFLASLAPQDAIREILDAVLELAIEAGIAEMQDA